MDLHKFRDGFFRMDRACLDSQAYRSMTKTGILVLQDFLSFVQWDGKQKFKGERKVPARMVNGDTLHYSFDEAERRGLSRPSFNRGISEVVAHGFLRIKKRGSGLQKDCNVYAWSNEWQNFGTAHFSPATRPKARSGAGFRKGHRFYPAHSVDGRTSIIVPPVILEEHSQKRPTSTIDDT